MTVQTGTPPVAGAATHVLPFTFPTLPERQTAAHVWVQESKRRNAPVTRWPDMAAEYHAALADRDLQLDTHPWHRLTSSPRAIRHWLIARDNWALKSRALVAQAPSGDIPGPGAETDLDTAPITGAIRYVRMGNDELLGAWSDAVTLHLFDPRSGIWAVAVGPGLAQWFAGHMTTWHPDAATVTFSAIDLGPRLAAPGIQFLTNVRPLTDPATAIRYFRPGSPFSGVFNPVNNGWCAIAGQNSDLVGYAHYSFRAERKGGHRQALDLLSRQDPGNIPANGVMGFTLFWEGVDATGRGQAGIEWASGLNEDNYLSRWLPTGLRRDVAVRLSRDLNCTIVDR